jgi:hypothetical protein
LIEEWISFPIKERLMKGTPTRTPYFSFKTLGSEMTLNHRVILEKYPLPNEVDGGSIPTMKSSLYLTGITFLKKPTR